MRKFITKATLQYDQDSFEPQIHFSGFIPLMALTDNVTPEGLDEIKANLGISLVEGIQESYAAHRKENPLP